MIVHDSYCKHTCHDSASILADATCNNAYMKTIGEILKEAREKHSLSQQDVANRVQMITGESFSRAALAQIESGSTKKPKPHNLQAACDVLEIDFRSALQGRLTPVITGTLTVTAPAPTMYAEGSVLPVSNAVMLGSFDVWDDNTPLRDDEVALPFFREVELAAGSGRVHQVIENHGLKLRFAKSTLKKKSVQAEHAYCVTVSGNSMEPALPDGSTVGIDTNNTSIKNGDMYAIDHAGELRVKMVYKQPGGGLRLRSFNTDEWPDEHYSEQESATIRILGRVFWSSALW